MREHRECAHRKDGICQCKDNSFAPFKCPWVDPDVPQDMNSYFPCQDWEPEANEGGEEMIRKDRCFRCDKPLGELSQGILLMYPEHDGYPPLYTIPRMYCHECIQSFYKWANVKHLTGRQMNSKEVAHEALRLLRKLPPLR